MTVNQIMARVARFKPMTRQNIYSHLRVLGIKPLGVARPSRYPDDTAERILIRLGFKQPTKAGLARSRRQLQKEAA